MLYIFDLGNVIVDIDFNRVLGAWSDFSRVPLATLKQNFAMGETFHQHERGEIGDEEFAERFCQEMDLPLSYEQFSHGWQAVFVAIRPEARIYQAVLQSEGFTAADAVFFDDNADNIEGANQLGITSILVTGKETIPNYFAKQLC